jgi:tryptophan halogenase
LKKTTIVVVGGGTTGALVCGMLCSSPTTKNWNIINVRSEDIPIIEVGESTIPQFARALKFMGVEQEFFEKTSAWPKYGAIFRGWQDEDLVGGWPIDGHRQETISYLKGLTEQKKIPRTGQFVLEGKYPYSKGGFYSDITLHIDANETSEFIFNKFDSQMDRVIYGNVNQVVINEGVLNHIVVDGEIIQADYFIDATGFKRVLISHFDPKFIESKLPCDAAVYTSIEGYDDYKTDMMTTSTAANAGWMWNIPLGGKRGRG